MVGEQVFICLFHCPAEDISARRYLVIRVMRSRGWQVDMRSDAGWWSCGGGYGVRAEAAANTSSEALVRLSNFLLASFLPLYLIPQVLGSCCFSNSSEPPCLIYDSLLCSATRQCARCGTFSSPNRLPKFRTFCSRTVALCSPWTQQVALLFALCAHQV